MMMMITTYNNNDTTHKSLLRYEKLLGRDMTTWGVPT